MQRIVIAAIGEAHRYSEIEFRRRKIAFIEDALLRGLPWWRWRKRRALQGWVEHYRRHIATFQAMPAMTIAEEDERRQKYKAWLDEQR